MSLKRLFAIIVILVLFQAGCGQSGDVESGTGQSNANQSSVSQSQQTEKDDRKYSLEMYQQIKIGNTYDEVVAITGDPGEAMVDNQRLKQYQWTNEDNSNINVTFYDNTVTAKCQAYLGPFLTGAQTVTAAMYNKLKEGMTLQEVTDILGPGTEKMLVIEGGKEKITMGWENSNGSSITLTLLEGKVVKINNLGLAN